MMNELKSKMLVCYIGEERNMGRLLEERLSAIGVQFMPVVDPASGVRIAQQYKPKVIIVDERVGRYESINVISTIRRILSKNETGIIWHASGVTASKVIDAHKAGANSILTRPMTMPSLVSRINELFKPSPGINFSREDSLENKTAEDTQKKLSKVQNLNAVPYVVEKVLNITCDSDSSAKDLEQVIETDPKVSAVILKRANSAFYTSVRQIGRILDAVARIGFREVRALILGLSVIDLFPRDQKTLSFDRVQFWISCLSTAVIAQTLAEVDKEIDPDDAFIAGLLHDLGRMILDEHFPDEFSRALSISERFRISLSDAEKKVFGMNHQDIGKIVLENWKFPKELQSVVGKHENLEEINKIEDPKERKLAQIVWAGEWITLLLGVGTSGERLINYPMPDQISGFNFWPAVLDKEFENKAMFRLDDLLSFIGADTARTPRKLQGETAVSKAVVYEESNLPMGPLAYLFENAQFEVKRAESIKDIGPVEPNVIAAIEFISFDSLRTSLQYLPAGRQPLLIVVPKGELPYDDKVKERAGLPIQKTIYLEKPFHCNELMQAIEKLMDFLN